MFFTGMTDKKWDVHFFQAEARRLANAFALSHGHNSCYKVTRWEILEDNYEGYYLHHPRVLQAYSCGFQQFQDSEHGEDENLLVSQQLLSDPDAIISQAGLNASTTSELEWTFSVVFSPTWRCPVLYFTTQLIDGRPLTRGEILALLRCADPKHDTSDSWEFVSYEEHPISGIPACFLHPCQTSNMLANITKSDVNGSTVPGRHLLAWMSLVLPSIGFAMPPCFFLQLRQRLHEIEDTYSLPNGV
jgi:hypothetical protein